MAVPTGRPSPANRQSNRVRRQLHALELLGGLLSQERAIASPFYELRRGAIVLHVGRFVPFPARWPSEGPRCDLCGVMLPGSKAAKVPSPKARSAGWSLFCPNCSGLVDKQGFELFPLALQELGPGRLKAEVDASREAGRSSTFRASPRNTQAIRRQIDIAIFRLGNRQTAPGAFDALLTEDTVDLCAEMAGQTGFVCHPIVGQAASPNHFQIQLDMIAAHHMEDIRRAKDELLQSGYDAPDDWLGFSLYESWTPGGKKPCDLISLTHAAADSGLSRTTLRRHIGPDGLLDYRPTNKKGTTSPIRVDRAEVTRLAQILCAKRKPNRK